MVAKLKSYPIENWALPFIFAFLILLVASAILMVAGQEGIAEQYTANAAYFSLLIGVTIQIISLSVNRKSTIWKRLLRIRKH